MSALAVPRPAGSSGGGVGDDARRLGRPVWAAFAVMGGLLLAYVCFLVFRTSHRYSPWLDGWAVVAFEFCASCLCLASGVLRPRYRWAALVMGAACLYW